MIESLFNCFLYKIQSFDVISTVVQGSLFICSYLYSRLFQNIHVLVVRLMVESSCEWNLKIWINTVWTSAESIKCRSTNFCRETT